MTEKVMDPLPVVAANMRSSDDDAVVAVLSCAAADAVRTRQSAVALSRDEANMMTPGAKVGAPSDGGAQGECKRHPD